MDRPSSFNGTEARSYERRVSFKAPSAEEEGADVEYVVACESAIKSGLDPSDPDGAKECQDDYCIKQVRVRTCVRSCVCVACAPRRCQDAPSPGSNSC